MIARLSELLLIKPGEQRQVVYFLLVFFFIGCGMAIGRGASEALFFKRYGIEYLPIMFIITSVLLSTVSLLYAAFVDSLPSERFYRVLFIVLGLVLMATWYATTIGHTDIVYPAFFLIYEIASELLLIHSAVYLNQNLVQTQSKRLMPIIFAGHQVGVIAGGFLLAGTSAVLGVDNMMLLWVAIIFLTYVVITHWHSRQGVSPYFRPGRKSRSPMGQSLSQLSQGLKLLKTSKLLRMSSLSLLFMVITVYILAYAVNTIYTEHFVTEESLSRFFGLLTAITGSLALLIQLFLTNRIIRDAGVKNVNYIFPITSIFSYGILLFSFILPAAIIASFNKETLMPAFAKPVRNIFISSLPSQLQGRAQAISIITVIPLGLAFAGGFLLFAQQSDNIHHFLLVGLVCAFAYLFYNRQMNRAYADEILTNLKKRLFIPERQARQILNTESSALMKDIEQGLMNHEDNVSLVYARVLSKSDPGRAANLIPQRMKTADIATRDQMVKLLQPAASSDVQERLKAELGKGDRHLDATVYKALFEARSPDQVTMVAELLEHDNPRLKAAGIYGALHYPVPELIEQAIDEWIELLKSVQAERYMPAVELITPKFAELYQSPDLLQQVKIKLSEMLRQDGHRFIRIALNIIATWPTDSFADISDDILNLADNEDWLIRKATIKASALLSEAQRNQLLIKALEDPHPNVRTTAIEFMASSQSDDVAYIQHLLISKRSGSPKAQRTLLEYLLDAGCDANTLHAISLAMARDALELKLVARHLELSNNDHFPGATLLQHALRERTIEIADLSLFALQSSRHDTDIAVIREGLNSHDNRQFAHACELLSMINDKTLASLILSVFEDQPASTVKQATAVMVNNHEQLLSWISKRSDPWLNECAGFYLRTLNANSHV